MRLILKPEWEFDEVVEAAWEVYRSPHQFAGYRINAIKAWGNMIGKRAALQRRHKYISRYKSKKEAAENLGMSYSTLRGIERFYESLPNEFIVFWNRILSITVTYTDNGKNYRKYQTFHKIWFFSVFSINKIHF